MSNQDSLMERTKLQTGHWWPLPTIVGTLLLIVEIYGEDEFDVVDSEDYELKKNKLAYSPGEMAQR